MDLKPLIDLVKKKGSSYIVADIVIRKGLGWLTRRIGVQKRGSIKELDKILLEEIRRNLLEDETIFLPKSLNFQYSADVLRSEGYYEDWIDEVSEYVIQILAQEYERVLSYAIRSRVKLVDDYDVLLDGENEREMAEGVLLWVSYQILKYRFYKRNMLNKLKRDKEIQKKYYDLVENSFEEWKKVSSKVAELIWKRLSIRDIFEALKREGEDLDLVKAILQLKYPERKEEIESCYDAVVFS